MLIGRMFVLGTLRVFVVFTFSVYFIRLWIGRWRWWCGELCVWELSDLYYSYQIHTLLHSSFFFNACCHYTIRNVIHRIEYDPSEARVWVVSSGTENTVFSWSVWRRLPLHEVRKLYLAKSILWFIMMSYIYLLTNIITRIIIFDISVAVMAYLTLPHFFIWSSVFLFDS